MADEPWEFELLRLFARGDAHEDLGWYEAEDGSLRFAVDCSDTFGWGCADSETVHEDELPDLRRAWEDSQELDHDWLWPTLWCARKRGKRPMRAFHATRLGHEPSWAPPGTMAALFDQVGPVRERTTWSP